MIMRVDVFPLTSAFINAGEYLLKNIPESSTKEQRIEAWKFYFKSTLILDQKDTVFVEFPSEADYFMFLLKWS